MENERVIEMNKKEGPDSIVIRQYKSEDEAQWVRSRLLAFLDSSYFDDIRKTKEIYEHPSLCLVAEEKGQIIGFMDVEYEGKKGDVCYLDGELGAVIWHLGVLPEYRRQGIAAKLWAAAREAISSYGIERVEVWTQDDAASNGWYESQGFLFKEAYLNAFLRGTTEDDTVKKYLQPDHLGDIYGIRCFNFEAPMERKDELSKICYRLHEVRLYEYKFYPQPQ